MTMPPLNKGLRILAVLALAAVAMPSQKAGAQNCTGDPWFFCDCARAAAQQCVWEYEACGGLWVEGCWETYSQCRLDSGIDQCQ
jgi:hypothetical protein